MQACGRVQSQYTEPPLERVPVWVRSSGAAAPRRSCFMLESVFCEISQMGCWSRHRGRREPAHTRFHLLEMYPQVPRAKPGALSPAHTLPLHPHLVGTATLPRGEQLSVTEQSLNSPIIPVHSRGQSAVSRQSRVGGAVLVASWGEARRWVSCLGLLSPLCIQRATWQQPLAHF